MADAYEAMTSHRVYRPATSPETARRELLTCAGSQFDPVVVAAFIAAPRERDHRFRTPVARRAAVTHQPA